MCFILSLNFSLSIVSYVLDTVTSWISTYGYAGAFFAALLETIFPPIPSELIFPLIGFTAQSKGLGLENALGMAIVGALGSTLGSIAIYLIALKLGKRVFHHLIQKQVTYRLFVLSLYSLLCD